MDIVGDDLGVCAQLAEQPCIGTDIAQQIKHTAMKNAGRVDDVIADDDR